MLRESILYRRLWYIKKRNIKSLQINSRLLGVILVIALITSYIQGNLLAYMADTYGPEIEAILRETSIEALESQSGEDIYSSLVMEERTLGNGETLLALDRTRAAALLDEVSRSLRQELDRVQNIPVEVPAGALSGVPLLARIGPFIKIRLKYSKVQEELISEVIKKGQGYEHALSLRIKTSMTIKMPMVEKEAEINTTLPLGRAFYQGVVNVDERL